MLKLIMIPIVMVIFALGMLWLDEKREIWRQEHEIRQLVRVSHRPHTDLRRTDKNYYVRNGWSSR